MVNPIENVTLKKGANYYIPNVSQSYFMCLFWMVVHAAWPIVFVRHIAIRLSMLVVFARKNIGGKDTLSCTAYRVFH